MITPAEQVALVETDHLFPVLRGKCQCRGPIRVQVAAACDDGGGDDGKEPVIISVPGDLLRFGHIYGQQGGLQSYEEVGISLPQSFETLDGFICHHPALEITIPRFLFDFCK